MGFTCARLYKRGCTVSDVRQPTGPRGRHPRLRVSRGVALGGGAAAAGIAGGAGAPAGGEELPLR
jgi:hypothetical protein